MARKLKYVGKGEFFPGVPATDFTCRSDKQAKELVESGLYEYVGKAEDETAASEAEDEEEG